MNRLRFLDRLGAVVTAGALAVACGGSSTTDPVTTTTVTAPEVTWVDPPAPEPVDAGAPKSDAAAACPPATVAYPGDAYLPRHPPRAANVCGAGQTTAIMSACETGSGLTCSGFSGAAIPCLSCLYGLATDATYGFRVFAPAYGASLLNVRGYALLKGESESCADALEDYAGCMTNACACATATRKTACFGKAKTPCSAWSKAVDAACPSGGATADLRAFVEAGAFGAASDTVLVAAAFCGGS